MRHKRKPVSPLVKRPPNILKLEKSWDKHTAIQSTTSKEDKINLGFSIFFNKQEKKTLRKQNPYSRKRSIISTKKTATLLLFHSYPKLKVDAMASGACLFLHPHTTYLYPLFPRQSLDRANTRENKERSQSWTVLGLSSNSNN